MIGKTGLYVMFLLFLGVLALMARAIGRLIVQHGGWEMFITHTTPYIMVVGWTVLTWVGTELFIKWLREWPR